MVEMFKSYNTCTCFYEVKNGHFSLKDEWIAWIAVQLAQFPLSIISSTLVHVTVLLK